MKSLGRVYRNHIAVKKIEKTFLVQKKIGNERGGKQQEQQKSRNRNTLDDVTKCCSGCPSIPKPIFEMQVFM